MGLISKSFYLEKPITGNGTGLSTIDAKNLSLPKRV
jgi:hypothetical protein